MNEPLEIVTHRGEVLLFNPNHDRLGRFASKIGEGIRSAGQSSYTKGVKEGAVKSAAGTAISVVAGGPAGGVVGGVAGFISGAVTVGAGLRSKKEAEGKLRIYEGTNVEYRRKLEQNVETAKVQIGTGAAMVGIYGALTVVSAFKIKSIMSNYEEYVGGRQSRYERAWNDYERSSRSRSTRPWPSSASQDQFKRMYRDLAKKHHPDVGGSTETMQKVNDAFSKNDWHGIEEMWKKLSDYIFTVVLQETDIDMKKSIGIMYRVFKDALNDGVDVMRIPAIKGDKFFPQEDGETLIPSEFMRYIVESLEAIK